MSASWCELFRHFTAAGVDPFEVRRRAGRCRTNALSVLDLTDQLTREALEVDEQDLVGEDYQRCQLCADAARAAGLDGVLAPERRPAGSVDPHGLRRPTRPRWRHHRD